MKEPVDLPNEELEKVATPSCVLHVRKNGETGRDLKDTGDGKNYWESTLQVRQRRSSSFTNEEHRLFWAS